MKKLSDSDLQNMLQQKMLNFEAEVPQGADEKVVAQLNVIRVNPVRTFTKYTIIAVAVLIVSIVYVNREKTIPDAAAGDGSLSKIDEKGDKDKQRTSDDGVSSELTLIPNKRSNFKVNSRKSSSDFHPLRESQQKLHENFTAEIIQSPIVVANADRATVNEQINVTDKIDSVSTAPSINVPMVDQNGDDKKNKRFRFLSVGITPLLSYRRMQPNRQDGAELSEFSTPSSLSSQRLGFRLSASGEFEFSRSRFIALGLSYTQYQNVFSYRSNEVIRNVELMNSVDQQVRALGLFAALRYPIRQMSTRTQFVSAGVDAQLLLSKHSSETGKGLYSISVGYSNDFPFNNGTLRITPTANYALTRFHYGGVQVQPFWFGVEAAWLFRKSEDFHDHGHK